MKRNKKLLLTSIAAMGALALGVGATSTFAWFEATTNAARILQEAETMGSLTVAQTTGSVGYDATIHFEADLTGLQNVELTTWVEDNTNYVLKAGTIPQGGAVGDVTYKTPTNGTYAIPVKAWITDDSDNGEKASQGHAARFLAGLNGSKTDVRKVTFSYANKTASASILGSEEVYFYCNANVSPQDYNKDSEGVSGAVGKRQQLSTSVADICTTNQSGDVTAFGSKVTIGYLYVRFEGSTRVHSTANTYTVDILAEAGTGAAADNSNS